MNLFQKQFCRRKISSILVVVLLAHGIAFGSIGLSVWRVVQEQINEIKSQYTTIAVPAGNDNNEIARILYAEGKRALLTQQKEYTYPGVLAEDMRGFLAAHVSGCESVSPYARGDFKSNWFDAYNNSMMVLAVRCVSVEDMTSPEPVAKAIYNNEYEVIGYEESVEKYYNAGFVLEEAICRLDAYDTIPQETEILLTSRLHTPDGQIPFEEGKTYFLFGVDMGVTILYDGLVNTEIEGKTYQVSKKIPVEYFAVDEIYAMGTHSVKYDRDTGNYFFSWQIQKDADGKTYSVLAEDSLPFYAKYEGDWRAFLESEDGTVWREKILPFCQLNYESAGVILTDNINSLLLFNNGTADVLEGRKFTMQEYEDGSNVCMISTAYAEKNNLFIGDTINLELYRSDLNYQLSFTGGTVSGYDRDFFVPVWVQDPCMPENRTGIKKDYEIVGIYTAPEFVEGWHSFQADTIFVPKASIPNAKEYETYSDVFMYSVILENGAEEKFEEYISAMGYGNQFVYSDQGYHETLEAVEVAADNALRLALAGAGAFLLASALFLILVFRQVRQSVLNVRRLGMNQKTVWKELVWAISALIWPAGVVGAILGCALYGAVTERVLESTAAVQLQSILLCAAGQVIFLLAAMAGCAVLMANVGLMNGRGRRNKRQRKVKNGKDKTFLFTNVKK